MISFQADQAATVKVRAIAVIEDPGRHGHRRDDRRVFLALQQRLDRSDRAIEIQRPDEAHESSAREREQGEALLVRRGLRRRTVALPNRQLGALRN